ncbi:nitroreductase [Terrihabitans soli]|uniref:Putative NAD(P)H nitroreductase n=1 Tax=Terrihabitans soli TaxID=708113 RepID=A0A6S6QW73_9HYPH|nr:nitroreductase [Terrihabitans soli]BCJ91280.1 nitroreductase [Terrihabitans soli]
MTEPADLLLRRRSVPAFMLRAPGPDAGQIETLLTAASRVPDHGKLVPWRFILVEGEFRAHLAEKLAAVELAAGTDPQKVADNKKKFDAPLTVIVVSRAGPHVKIPEWEQVLSAGAVCMNLILAAHALGFAANWLTGAAIYDRAGADVLELAHSEKVAGLIFIGTADQAPPDRPRPPLDEIVSRWQG